MKSQLTIDELLNAINGLLEKGLKVSEAEKQLGYGDGEARKLLSSAGFKCDRKLKKYVPKNNIVTGSNTIAQQREQEAHQNKVVTSSNGVMPRQELKREVIQKQVFTKEQVDILHKIINEYQVRQQIQEVSEIDKGKTINRNVRVYEKQFEAFAAWCKENNVTQADALYKAINMLMDH